jgi:hypothetical protein
MHVTVDMVSDPPAVSLLEPDDCTRFDVVVHGPGDDDLLGRVLAGSAIGRVEGGEALVSVVAIRRLASVSVSEEWEADFRAMLDYARSRGWLADDGLDIRAHVEWH